MIYSTLLVALSAFASVASAQSNFTSCCNVDPNSVDLPTRQSWCRAQMNTCPEVCTNGQTSNNTCDANALTYSCTCQTGNTPNISSYMQTLPSLECDEWKTQCTAAHPNDLAGQTFCQSFTCGMKNGSALAAAASSAASASSGSGAASTGSATSGGASSTSSSAATTSSAAAAALRVAKTYGTGAVAAGLFALFGLAL